MEEQQVIDAPQKRRRSWRTFAVVTLLAVISTIGFAAAADSFDFSVRGGRNGGSLLRCPGGMDRLGHTFGEGLTTVFEGDPEVMVDIVANYDPEGFLLEQFSTGTHGGTHLDAPAHFVEGARSVDQLDATEFVWPAYVIDVRDRVAEEGGNFQLTEEDIRDYERDNGRINEGSLVIIYTGHDELFGTDSYTSVPHPGFSGAAVIWMIENRWIGGLGSDGLGPDASEDEFFDATYQMLLADGVAIPGINNLDTMNANGDIIIASAVPLLNGSGFLTDPLACHGRTRGNNR